MSAEDVRIIMSFLPFDHNMGNNSPDTRPDAFSDEIEKIKPKDRVEEQEEIAMFISQVFESEKEQINLETYTDFNTNNSSEMLFSLMSLLHSKLPCAAHFFRLKNNNDRKRNNKSSHVN